MSDQGRLEYVEMLTDMAKLVVKGRRVPALALDESSAVGRKGKRLVQRADVVLADIDKTRRSLRPVAQCAVMALFLASYLIVFQAAVAPPAEKFEENPGVYYDDNYEDLGIGDEINGAFIVKGVDGRYQLCINYEFVRYLTEDEVASDKYKNLYIFEENIQR